MPCGASSYVRASDIASRAEDEAVRRARDGVGVCDAERRAVLA